MSQDRQLLAEFRRNGSETAFAHLVERHLKLVHSTAMRVVNGDTHLAQDIAQTVFANLARKAAALPADVALAGWLHRDIGTHDMAEAVPALIEIVNTTKRKDHRMRALELLNAIQPGVLAANPAADKLLQTHEADHAFAMKVNLLEVRHQQMPLPDLIEGLKEHPGAIGAIAGVLGAIGPDAKEALPLLKSALPSLAATSTSPADMFEAIQVRQAMANAIQKIAPDQPKVLFTYADTTSFMKVFRDPAFKSDEVHRKALHEAMKLVWPVRGSAMEMTPEQMHLFLDSLKTNDPAAYDAVAAKVASIDPQFFNAPSRK